MTNKELIRFIRKHKMKLNVPMVGKHDVVHVHAEKQGIIDMYTSETEYETGMEIHITNGEMFMDVDY